MWIKDIEYTVFSRLKAVGTSKLKSKYPNISFTTSDRVVGEPSFPTVYVRKMQGAERGQDLEGKSINAILTTFQIEVTDNGTNDSVAEEVADVMLDIMKSMRFQMMGEPITESTDTVFRCIARYQRIIGYNDVL